MSTEKMADHEAAVRKLVFYFGELNLKTAADIDPSSDVIDKLWNDYFWVIHRIFPSAGLENSLGQKTVVGKYTILEMIYFDYKTREGHGELTKFTEDQKATINRQSLRRGLRW